ncbi:hypothetical protein [Streptosporangium sp. NPDC004631]
MVRAPFLPGTVHDLLPSWLARAMVELIKIRALAEAGVPPARVRELLQADLPADWRYETLLAWSRPDRRIAYRNRPSW